MDDNRDAADSLSLLLATRGHHTKTVYEGVAALDAAADFRPDTIFCDLGMPGISGFEVAARLRSDSRYPPAVLVAVTGWGTGKDKRRALEGGFDLHITKPIAIEELDAVLLRASATSASREQPAVLRKDGSLDRLEGWDRKAFSFSSPDELSEAITGGVDRCDVRRMRDRLQQAKAKNLCPSSTGDPKPTGKGTAIDSMDKVREFRNRHCISPSFEVLTRRVMFSELALQVALWGGLVLKS